MAKSWSIGGLSLANSEVNGFRRDSADLTSPNLIREYAASITDCNWLASKRFADPSVHHLESMPFQMNWHEISQDKQKIYENDSSASYHVCMAHEFNFQNSR